jgi:hypothetical protein
MWTNPSPEPDTKVFNLVTGIEFKFELARGQNKPHGGKYAGDRRDTTSIGYATIRAVGELLR